MSFYPLGSFAYLYLDDRHAISFENGLVMSELDITNINKFLSGCAVLSQATLSLMIFCIYNYEVVNYLNLNTM